MCKAREVREGKFVEIDLEGDSCLHIGACMVREKHVLTYIQLMYVATCMQTKEK